MGSELTVAPCVAYRLSLGLNLSLQKVLTGSVQSSILVTERPPHVFTIDLVPCPHVTEHSAGVLVHPLAGALFGISGILTTVDRSVVVEVVDVIGVVCGVCVVALFVAVDAVTVVVSAVVVVVAAVVVVGAAVVVVVVVAAAVVVVGHYKL